MKGIHELTEAQLVRAIPARVRKRLMQGKKDELWPNQRAIGSPKISF
jgi:hypothetical protein